MKYKFLWLAILFSMYVTSAYGQDLNYIEGIYGSSKTNIWEVRNDLFMSARFDNDGKICKAVFQPNRFAENTVLLGTKYIDLNQAKYVIDAISPHDSRGDLFIGGITHYNGSTVRTRYIYDKIVITYFSSINVIIEPQPKTKIKSGNTSNHSKQTDRSSNEETCIEVIVIDWNNRECVSN